MVASRSTRHGSARGTCATNAASRPRRHRPGHRCLARACSGTGRSLSAPTRDAGGAFNPEHGSGCRGGEAQTLVTGCASAAASVLLREAPSGAAQGRFVCRAGASRQRRAPVRRIHKCLKYIHVLVSVTQAHDAPQRHALLTSRQVLVSQVPGSQAATCFMTGTAFASVVAQRHAVQWLLRWRHGGTETRVARQLPHQWLQHAAASRSRRQQRCLCARATGSSDGDEPKTSPQVSAVRVDRSLVERTARLANLEYSEEELEALVPAFQGMLQFVETLRLAESADESEAESTVWTPTSARSWRDLRPDVVTEFGDRQAIRAQFPAREHDLLRVPRVIGGDGDESQ